MSDDEEIQALGETYRILSKLPEDAQRRILDWLHSRLEYDFNKKKTQEMEG